jgi:hypothetical protein
MLTALSPSREIAMLVVVGRRHVGLLLAALLFGACGEPRLPRFARPPSVDAGESDAAADDDGGD